MISDTKLILFIERLERFQQILLEPFLELFEEWFTEVSDLLKDEILNNLTIIPETGRNIYLRRIKSKIESKFNISTSATFLTSLIQRYNLEQYTPRNSNILSLEFPYREVPEIKILLATSIDQFGLIYQRKVLAKNMQMDFYRYAALLEASKMIKIIESLLNEKDSSSKARSQSFRLAGKPATIKSSASDLHDSLVRNGFLDKASKVDFAKLFTGQKPNDKILWLGKKGELKGLIAQLFSENKIETGGTNRWVITAENFKLIGPHQDFTAKSIKDAKKPKTLDKINRIVEKLI